MILALTVSTQASFPLVLPRHLEDMASHLHYAGEYWDDTSNMSGDKNLVTLEAADYAAFYIYVFKFLSKHNDKNNCYIPDMISSTAVDALILN